MVSRKKNLIKKIQVRTIYEESNNDTTGSLLHINSPVHITSEKDSILDINFIANHPAMRATLAQPSRRDLYYPEPSWELEESIRERDHHTCQICGKPGMDVDHIVPLEISHNNDPSNLRVLCRACNLRRGRHCLHHAKENPIQLGFEVNP